MLKTLTVKHKDSVDHKWVDMANRGMVGNNLHHGKWVVNNLHHGKWVVATANQDTVVGNLKWVAMANLKEVAPAWWTLKEWTRTLRHRKEWTLKELTHTLKYHKEWTLKEWTHTLRHRKEWTEEFSLKTQVRNTKNSKI